MRDSFGNTLGNYRLARLEAAFAARWGMFRAEELGRRARGIWLAVAFRAKEFLIVLLLRTISNFNEKQRGTTFPIL